ncbi:peptidase C45 [Advenella sp. WQ 585]|uniref:Peptidase C45 n=1 Tax=Advenella mandrilli TaxID=2800330 RepID=A0ABS1ED38_9BURK|nr:C45 family peptidase [Advenella mandrilli]MBK1780803.1 peptidase C45 [Advenella mandrilli]
MLPFIDVKGTAYEAGQQLGEFGLAGAKAFLLKSEDWAYITAFKNDPRAAQMQALVRQHFPLIWEEIRGLAKGLGLDETDVFLWNCRGDIWAMSKDGCTTVQYPQTAGQPYRRICHNEDGYPEFNGYCAIARVQIENQPAFTSFIYPASIPGHTFAVTDAGLAMAVNNLRARHVGSGIPRMVLTRAILMQPDLEHAVELLRNQPRAGGFHLSLAHQDSPELLSIEFFSSICSVKKISTNSVHANHAIHPETVNYPQIITGSSGWRQLRGQQMLAENVRHPLEILADTSNASFPVYRKQANDSDHENTLATADMQISDAGIEWQVYDGAWPATPLYVFHNANLVSSNI